jgi:hypothetical protein
MQYPEDGTSYSASSFLAAIKSVTGYTMALQCAAGKTSSDTQFVETIGTCYTKSLQLMDCPSNLGWTCTDSLYFPTTAGTGTAYSV